MAAIGIISVFLSLQLKSTKAEYGILLAITTGILIFYFGIKRLGIIIDAITIVKNSLGSSGENIQLLLKIIGIAYVCDFSADICKDSGHQTIGNQIHMFGKLCVLALCTPVLVRLFDVIRELM